MNKILSYEDMEINVIQSTLSPDHIIKVACAITQKQDLWDDGIPNPKLIKYLFTANHTSPFEHCYITFLIKNVSRSFLAQITRHRMGSFTAASQHYQKYDSYPDILDPQMVNMKTVRTFLSDVNSMYDYLTSLLLLPKEEARQVLSNSKAVNILWTVNARSLINFFNQRLCKRNVQEMHMFATKLKEICINWFPDLFVLVGPDCETLGGCTQGKMKAEVCRNENIPNFKR